jgi:FkbM family methyltransferase
MSIIARLQKIARFIKEYGITPSPKSLKNDLLSIEEKFHAGKMNKYEYLSEKHEFNKILLEYANLITNSSIERIEILPDMLLFTFKSLNIQLEADGGARSAPFEILNFGSYEPQDESMAYVLIQNGDTILDIGAHIGWYSINFAKRFPVSKVYAFEPIEYTFEFLKRNIERNHLSNVIFLNFGLSSREEEKDLYYFKGGSAIASIENLIPHQNVKKIKCRLRPLDAILAELEMKSVNFIKCDIEGAELFMLQGAQKTIDKFKPVILIELYEEWCNKCGYSSKDIIVFLTSMGYGLFQAIEGKLHNIESTKLVDNERYNYFFLNKEKHSELIKKCC